MWITSLVACREPIEPWWDKTADPSHTGAVHSAETTEPPTHSAEVDHTGRVDTLPGCTGQPEGCVYLTPDERGDWFGRAIDVGDVDGDGTVEVMVSEGSAFGVLETPAVHLLRPPWVSGAAHEAAGAHYLGEYGLDWGYPATMFVRDHLIGILADLDPYVYTATLTPSTTGTFTRDDIAGFVSTEGVRSTSVAWDLSECWVDGGPATCLVTSDLEGRGTIHVVPGGIRGEVRLDGLATRYFGDVESQLEDVDGTSDLDGDDQADLAFAAAEDGPFSPLGHGRVGVITNAPAGEHPAWDIATTTLVGERFAGAFGMLVKTADLDGDNQADLLVNAPFADEGTLYVFRGPLAAGERSASTADWIFRNPGDYRFGYDYAVGDFDGDGRPDLAIGQPYGAAGSDEGRTYVFLAPPPGTWGPELAALELRSGVGTWDNFGLAMDAGDLDADGRDDLVIAAPEDPTIGLGAGSVLMFFGRGLFP